MVARMIKNIRVSIGAVQHELVVSTCEIVPSSVTYTGGTDAGTVTDSTWVCNITARADYDVPDSLVNFLLEHEGERATIDYVPNAGGTSSYSTDVTLAAPRIGGGVNTWGELSVALPATKPTRSAYVPAP